MNDKQLLNFSAYVEQTLMMDPAVFMEQRMAELEQLARYRSERMALCKEWSKDPRAAREKILGKTKDIGEAIVKDMEPKLEANPEYLKFQYKPPDLRIKPLSKPTPLRWHEKLWRSIKKPFSSK